MRRERERMLRSSRSSVLKTVERSFLLKPYKRGNALIENLDQFAKVASCRIRFATVSSSRLLARRASRSQGCRSWQEPRSRVARSASVYAAANATTNGDLICPSRLNRNAAAERIASLILKRQQLAASSS